MAFSSRITLPRPLPAFLTSPFRSMLPWEAGGGSLLPPTSVAISGTVSIGSALTAVVTGGLPSPTRQWKRNGVNIGGETGATYTCVAADISDAVAITCVATNAAGSTTSNGLSFAPDTIFPGSAIGLCTTGLTTADGDTTVDQWAAGFGGKKAAVVLSAPAAGNRPAYNATGGPGSRPLITFDGVDDVLRAATVTMGASWGGFQIDVVGFLAGAETLSDRIARYAPTSNSIDFGVSTTPAMRLITAGTGGATSLGTTTVTATHRQMTADGFSGASGTQSVRLNNGAAEDTDAHTHAAWADAQPFSVAATAAGTAGVNMSCIGWAVHFTASAGDALTASQRADLRAFFQNKIGVA